MAKKDSRRSDWMGEHCEYTLHVICGSETSALLPSSHSFDVLLCVDSVLQFALLSLRAVIVAQTVAPSSCVVDRPLTRIVLNVDRFVFGNDFCTSSTIPSEFTAVGGRDAASFIVLPPRLSCRFVSSLSMPFGDGRFDFGSVGGGTCAFFNTFLFDFSWLLFLSFASPAPIDWFEWYPLDSRCGWGNSVFVLRITVVTSCISDISTPFISHLWTEWKKIFISRDARVQIGCERIKNKYIFWNLDEFKSGCRYHKLVGSGFALMWPLIQRSKTNPKLYFCMINGKIGFNLTGIDYTRLNRRLSHIKRTERKWSEWALDMWTRSELNQKLIFVK